MPGETESLSFKKIASDGKMKRVCQPNKKPKEEVQVDTNTLAHTTWNCKYHIVFAPKYRRQVIYGKIKVDIGKILRELVNGRI